MAGGHLSGTTGDAGRVVQAGGNIINSTVNHNRSPGPVVLTAVIVAAVAAVATAGVYAVVSDRSAAGAVGTTSVPSEDTSADGPIPRGSGAWPGSETSPGTGAGSGAQTRSSPSQDPSASPAEQWRGTLALDTDGGTELDSERPGRTRSLLFSGDIGLGSDGMTWQVMAMSGGTITLWREAGKEPDYADCAAATETAGSYMAPARQDAVLCVRTDEGRIARLELTRIPDGLTPSVEFEAVVWELPASSSG